MASFAGRIFATGSMGFVAFAGWIAGSIYPAPQSLTEKLNRPAIEARLRAVSQTALESAIATGKMIAVEEVGEEQLADTPELAALSPQSITTQSAAAPIAFEQKLALCPGMTISNAPDKDAAGDVANFAALVEANGLPLAVNPTHGACLSSGFGPRGARTHRGVDYHSATGGPILAAAPGTIIELKYRDDYGNMLLIDHGHGVYTRYAHLSAFQKGLAVGSKVEAGDQIGLMGNTAGYPLPIHLHYEVLTGDYNTPKASFGLEARDPFDFPAVSTPIKGG
jgi:murein DD-endopeptidase MepM/ murein hydrolase activator NlpD